MTSQEPRSVIRPVDIMPLLEEVLATNKRLVDALAATDERAAALDKRVQALEKSARTAAPGK